MPLLSIFLIFASTVTYRGTVVLPHDPTTGLVTIRTTSGKTLQSTTINIVPPPNLSVGDKVEATETIEDNPRDEKRVDRLITDIHIIGHADKPTHNLVSATQVNNGEVNDQFVFVTGKVLDVYRDDVDRRFIFIVISCKDGSVLWSGACGPENDANLVELIGATVTAYGRAASGSFVARRNCGPCICSSSIKSLEVITPPQTDLFEAPEISLLKNMPPKNISAQTRHRARGQVLAVWGRNTILIRQADGTQTTVRISGDSLPGCGDQIEAVGFPESDLYTINLARAQWRPVSHTNHLTQTNPPPLRINIADLLPDVNGGIEPKARLHGQLIQVDGIICRIPIPGDNNGGALIELNGHFLTIDPGASLDAFEKLKLGMKARFTGIAIFEKEYWRPNICFPEIKKVMLVLRSPKDIEVISGPPFWTPLKFTILVVILSFVIIVALLRNRTIRRIGEERMSERTRLAAELHDTIAQNLTGAAIQLETAESLAMNGPESLKRILAMTTKIMHVSREELRDCIWDLRNKTLDEKRVEDALHRTLIQHLYGAHLKLRFHVNRADITDCSAHAIISITRELVSNAIHHGHASTISIAGTLDGNKIRFSVSDNGIGFDPQNAPGPREGHFGITGIRERVRKLNGSFCMTSSASKGTKTIITLPR